MKVLLFLLIAGSCAHWYPVNRSDYVLMKQNDFLISNIYVNPTDIDKDDGVIRFDYSIIVKNLKNVSRKINLENSSITVGLRKIPIDCRTFQRKKLTESLKAQETMRISCKVVLNKAEGVFQIGHYKSLIQIPLDGSAAKFAYLLRPEDFQ